MWYRNAAVRKLYDLRFLLFGGRSWVYNVETTTTVVVIVVEKKFEYRYDSMEKRVGDIE